MKKVHLILPDLFLPKAFATEVSADLALPALQKLLARATSGPAAARSVESALCAAFGVSLQNDVPIAPISAAFDGLADGCYLRADPVHLRLQRDQMLLSQAEITGEQARQFCAGLNEHFAGQGMTFFAPHPQRWYVRVESLPDMQTTPLSEVMGGNVRGALPKGADAPRWHQVFNEAQMLLFAHPLNAVREEHGELSINSLWFWGGGKDAGGWAKNYDAVGSDDVLAEMFAAAAGVPHHRLSGQWRMVADRQLLLWSGLSVALQAGDLHAWRMALQAFETDCAQPLWRALRTGKIARLQIDVPSGENSQSWVMTRGDTWRVWRRSKPLSHYSIV